MDVAHELDSNKAHHLDEKAHLNCRDMMSGSIHILPKHIGNNNSEFLT